MSVSPIGGLCPSSKKIKKSSPQPANNDHNAKKYRTFDNLQREKILSDLRQGVITILKLDPSHESLYNQDFLELLAKIGIEEYNKLIKKIFSQRFENFSPNNKAYTQWRKKIKTWILNCGKPETRGGLVVANDKLPLFRKKVMEILQNLPYKSFTILKNKILHILEEFHNENQKNPLKPKPFNKKTCSKHWWFNFMVKNPNIKDLWENLPLNGRVQYKEITTSQSSISLDDSFSYEPLPESFSPALLEDNEEEYQQEQVQETEEVKETEEVEVFTTFKTEENWTEPRLKNLSATLELPEIYEQLCDDFAEDLEEPYYNKMQEEKIVEATPTGIEDGRCSRALQGNFSWSFMLADDDKVEFERDFDGAGQMFSELYNQAPMGAKSDFFCLFRTKGY